MNPTKKIEQISIKGNDTAVSLFKEKSAEMGLKHADYLAYLLSLDNGLQDVLNAPALVDIVDTAKKQGVTVEKFVIDACETAIHRAAIIRENPADKKINDYVQSVIDANEKAQNWFEKVEITQAKIAQMTGCNRPAIAKYLKDNDVRLEAHYLACGIENDHNRKVFNYERKQGKGG